MNDFAFLHRADYATRRRIVGSESQARQTSGTLSQTLNGSVPGIWLWDQSPSSLFAQYGSLRGASSFQVSYPKVYIDGIQVANPLLLTELSPDAVERVEVIRGPQGAALYGADAIGGVINIVSRRPTKRTLELRPQYGSRTSPKLDLYASDVWGKVGVAVNGSVFDTDGFKQVISNEQGPVDTEARVEFKNFNVKLDYAPTARVSAFLSQIPGADVMPFTIHLNARQPDSLSGPPVQA